MIYTFVIDKKILPNAILLIEMKQPVCNIQKGELHLQF